MLPTQFIDLAPDNFEQLDWIAALWNSAVSESLPISTRFVQYNIRPVAGVAQWGLIALDGDERPIAFVIASAHPAAPAAMDAHAGWIDAIAVAPPFQRQGIGGELLTRAESWLAAQGCTHIRIGSSLRPFVPGVPVELATSGFFTAFGYAPPWDDGIVWDVARNLNTYEPPAGLDTLPCAVRSAQPRDRSALIAFLETEFPGRWTYECKEFLEHGGRIADYMLLWTDAGVQGACRLTFEDSLGPIERFYPYGLPRPWGQLGSIGIAEAVRGRRFGLALLDGGLRRLHNNGVNGCVIDWTTLIDFYAKAGFETYRGYQQLHKEIAV